MSSPLSHLPIGRRRRLARTLGLFALLFLAVGAVAATGTGAAAPVFSAIALIVALFLVLVAWGMRHSVTIDLDEQRLDRAIEDAVAAHGGATPGCGCGHDHDPAEMEVRDAASPAIHSCAHDGGGAGCAHDCDTCVLASMRPSQGTAARVSAGEDVSGR